MATQDSEGEVEDDDGSVPDARITPLGLVAASGFIEATYLQLISLELSNSCR